jgi:hypothetical protein
VLRKCSYAWIILAILCWGCERRSAPTRQPAAAQSKASPEQDAAARWRECVSRVQTADGAPIQFDDARIEHDAWIQTNQSLEDALRQYPNHAGMLRDLVIANMSLLSFEAGSPLKSRVCQITAGAASRLESTGGDQRLVFQAREFVFQAMKIYPCVNGRMKALPSAAPAQFLNILTRSIGSIVCTTDRTLDPSPDPRLLWDEMFFVLSPAGTMLPENTSAYVLDRQGGGAETRYYLFFRSIHGEQLVSVFGHERPELSTLDALIDRSVAEARHEVR